MRLFFIDETDRQEGAQGPFFCICSLAIGGENLLIASNELEDIKVKYSLSNLKDARKTGLPEATRLALTKEIYDCLSKYNVKVRATIIGDFTLSKHPPKEDSYMGAISFLIERFVLSLKDDKETGIIVFDSVEEKLQKKLREQFYEHIRNEKLTMFSRYTLTTKILGQYRDYLYPSILFSDDRHSILIQAVDLMATSLNSAIVNVLKVEKFIKIPDLPQNNPFLGIYWPLFMRSPGGEVAGWGIKVWN